ncbi:major facilitator superfamily protein [Neofusicoccum parvum]|nr:major facilitator superfamily protein [Neofusicoccum parvum]
MLARLSAAWALRVIGVVAGAANLAAIAFVRSRNRQIQPTLRGFDARLLRRQSVLLLLAWAFVSNLGFMTLLYSLSAYAKEIGLSDSQASAITAILNLGTAVGRPCVGLLSDRNGRVEVAGITTFACTVFVFALWIPARSFGLLAVFALLSGATLGTWWMDPPALPLDCRRAQNQEPRTVTMTDYDSDASSTPNDD